MHFLGGISDQRDHFVDRLVQLQRQRSSHVAHLGNQEALKNNKALHRVYLSFYASPALLINGALFQFKTPEKQPSQEFCKVTHNINPFCMCKVQKQQAHKLTRCLSWQSALFPRTVTKCASCEYHLGATYLNLAQVPWQPAWQLGKKE